MKLNIIAIIIGLMCLIVGLALGYGLGASRVEEEKVAPEERSENITALLNIEKSSLLDDITAQFRGEVVEIEENSLLIKEGADSLRGEIGDFAPSVAKIRLTEDGKKELVDQEFKFQDVKIGDKVVVNCILREGHWQIIGVTIEEISPH